MKVTSNLIDTQVESVEPCSYLLCCTHDLSFPRSFQPPSTTTIIPAFYMTTQILSCCIEPIKSIAMCLACGSWPWPHSVPVAPAPTKEHVIHLSSDPEFYEDPRKVRYFFEFPRCKCCYLHFVLSDHFATLFAYSSGTLCSAFFVLSQIANRKSQIALVSQHSNIKKLKDVDGHPK